MIDHLKRSEMFRAHISGEPVLFPLMTQPCRPVEKENEANYMRDLLARTIARLKGPTHG